MLRWNLVQLQLCLVSSYVKFRRKNSEKSQMNSTIACKVESAQVCDWLVWTKVERTDPATCRPHPCTSQSRHYDVILSSMTSSRFHLNEKSILTVGDDGVDEDVADNNIDHIAQCLYSLCCRPAHYRCCHCCKSKLSLCQCHRVTWFIPMGTLVDAIVDCRNIPGQSCTLTEYSHLMWSVSFGVQKP